MAEKSKYPDMRKGEHRDLLQRVRDRYKVMYDADHENRDAAMEDMKFATVPGSQWDDNMKQERGKRPMYEFNKLRIKGKRVINQMRSNRPGVKIRPVEGGDVDTAEILEGLVRNIWNQSDADTVIDYEADYQVHAGMGAWRVDTEYADDDSFNQDIRVRMIENPFTVYCDPSAKDFLKRDARDWCITTRMSEEEFEEAYPNMPKTNFQGDDNWDDQEYWHEEDAVRICEYWYKTPTEKELLLLHTGQVVDPESDEGIAILADPAQADLIKARRTVETHKIQYCVASGERILEGPTDWAGRQFPFVMVYGEYIVVDGKPYWYGLVRWAKDAQRSYNISRTAVAETIAQAPLSKWWATAEQASGLTKQWSEAHKKNFPFMIYNADPKAPGPPQRMGGAEVPMALIQETQMAPDELKDVTGIYDASLGQRTNETSGRAIFARQNEGEITNFNYQDNMEKGVQRTYEILLDLIPEIYDVEREVRVLGADGAERYKKVNQLVRDPATNKTLRIHDLSQGKYDVTITSGPSYSTKRQEAAELYTQVLQMMPDIMPVAGDLIFKSMDLPYSDEIADRLKLLLPPQIQEAMENEDVPPEVMQMMAQAKSMTEQATALMQEAAAAKQEADSTIAKMKEDGANVGREKAEVRAAQAEFEKLVAEELRKLADLKAEILPGLVKHADYEEAAGRVQEMEQVVNKIDEIVAKFMVATDMTVGRKMTGGDVRRNKGALEATVNYDDGTSKVVRAVRDGGKLRVLPEGETSE